MSQTVGDFILQRLTDWGVKRVFGYPGDGINGIMGAMGRAFDRFDYVRVRHEDQRSSHGHGADTDIVVASAKAYISAINHVLSRTGTTRGQHPHMNPETPEVRA